MICGVSANIPREQAQAWNHIIYGTAVTTTVALTMLGGYYLNTRNHSTKEFSNLFAATTICALSSLTLTVIWLRCHCVNSQDNI